MVKPLEYYIVDAVGVDPTFVQGDSLSIEFRGQMALITWAGVKVMPAEDLQGLVNFAVRQRRRDLDG